jgi:2-keto-4-pentenoate hydratase/2-oxohepta-3-ene-1,7-dioic acid hydratase in catechol pathway
LEKVADDIAAGKYSQSVPAKGASLYTPIMFPNKVACVGANFVSHLKEMGFSNTAKWDPLPFFMAPPTTSLVGPGETVEIPRSTQEFDWELELVVVVGARLKHASREEASAAIAGYMIGLDLSCRDLVLADKQLKVDLSRGKLQDSMKPAGPAVIPAKFVPNSDNLKMTLHVNGRQMMDGSTSEMLYKCDEILKVISEHITLEPGDIVLTGSPSGSAKANNVPFLKVGDEIDARIEGVGELIVRMKAC